MNISKFKLRTKIKYEIEKLKRKIQPYQDKLDILEHDLKELDEDEELKDKLQNYEKQISEYKREKQAYVSNLKKEMMYSEIFKLRSNISYENWKTFFKQDNFSNDTLRKMSGYLIQIRELNESFKDMAEKLCIDFDIFKEWCQDFKPDNAVYDNKIMDMTFE
jgi:chromosome segregation ATPase